MEKSFKFTIPSLIFNVATICIVSYALLEYLPISLPQSAFIKRPLLIIGGCCLLFNARVILQSIKKKEYFTTVLLLFVFCLTILLPPLFGLNTTTKYLLFNFLLYFAELFSLMILAAETGRTKNVFNILFWYALFLLIITDFLIFTGVRFTDGFFETYFIGTKFTVSYLHIYTLAFFLAREKNPSLLKSKNLIFLIFYSFFVFFIVSRVKCNTGMIGYLIFITLTLIFSIFSSTVLRKCSSVSVFITVIVGCTLFAFVSESVLSIPSVENFIVNVLHRDATMTGRTYIYGMYAEAMEGHWLWGYGYTNKFNIAMRLFKYANAQNALLQWILQIGIVPVTILVTMFLTFIKRLTEKKSLKQILSILALVYTFMLLGTVEITMSMNFFLCMALIFMWSHQKTEEKI